MPPQHRVPVIQARIGTDELPRSRLPTHTPTESTRPVQASRLRLNISRIPRTNLIRKREELTSPAKLKTLKHRGLSLDLRPHQPRPGVLLPRQRYLGLGSVAGRHSTVIRP